MNVSYNTAKLAKGKGYNEFCYDKYCTKECGRYYWQKEGGLVIAINHLDETCCSNHGIEEINLINAPLQYELQKWLRESHNTDCIVFPNGLGKYSYKLYIYNKDFDIIEAYRIYDTYEEALEEALIAALNLIKNEN